MKIIFTILFFSLSFILTKANETKVKQSVTEIKIGMHTKEVLKVAGLPKSKGKTFTNYIQWDYADKGTEKRLPNNENKIWIVFDAKDKVKEIWYYRACHLGFESIQMNETKKKTNNTKMLFLQNIKSNNNKSKSNQ